MSSGDLSRQLRKPKTHRGRKFLQQREPRVYENDKQTLLIRGAHTSQIVHDFLTDLKPLVNKLKWKNSVLPFEDASFIERMCEKFDSSLFVFAAHSKKRPNNIVIGRLHDHEILDMYELGIENYKSMRSSGVKFSLGAKPLLIFSGDAFEETEETQRFKSLLIDLFRGPKVSRINSSGIEHVMHFIMPSDKKLLLRVSGVKLRPVSKGSEKDESSPLTEAFRAPWGPYVQVELQNSAPEVDFVLRRRLMPSEEKWKRACRVPAELRPKKEKFKNRSMDVFGSKVAQVHVHREQGLENLRPGASMRTALTGSVKRGFERRDPSADKPAAGVKSGKKRKPEKAGATPSGPKRPRTS